MKNTTMQRRNSMLGAVIVIALLWPSPLLAQARGLRELRVPYALGGSTSFFWVAYRSGSFEKHGIKVLPIFMRGGGVRQSKR
jgi:ABC-type nitrate/sulfonate/bicarbonate transport system substrate-binding protein